MHLASPVQVQQARNHARLPAAVACLRSWLGSRCSWHVVHEADDVAFCSCRITLVLLFTFCSVSVHWVYRLLCSNGTVKWVFKNASIYKIPGTYDYEDITVNPQRMDIKAGNSIIHVIDTL